MMKKTTFLVPFSIFFLASVAHAEMPELRLSWNRDLKVDLQILDDVPKPERVHVISERGAIVSSHLFSEYTEGRVNFAELERGTYQLVLVVEAGNQIRAERFDFDPDSNREVTSLPLRLLATGTFGDRTANPTNTTGNVISPFNPEQ
ncbi:MAG: hypothetical protein AAGF67_10880 [Verrucomicrobiota bacterium]